MELFVLPHPGNHVLVVDPLLSGDVLPVGAQTLGGSVRQLAGVLLVGAQPPGVGLSVIC